jgi:DNA polymerase I-like protein with 3'-5' exonuclease and polymerase domains
MRIMKEEMEQNVPLDSEVPFKVDIHAADNWSALK